MAPAGSLHLRGGDRWGTARSVVRRGEEGVPPAAAIGTAGRLVQLGRDPGRLQLTVRRDGHVDLCAQRVLEREGGRTGRQVRPRCVADLDAATQDDLAVRAPVEDEGAVVYLRPETAQGSYVNFKNVQVSSRKKVPFGIAQIGKSFRNEISPGNFVFRMREFEQMEMQFFVRPGTELDWFEKWKTTRMKWHRALGFGDENYRFHEHEKLAHYANAAVDVEFKFPFGFKEVEGIHSRTDFDLSQHEEYSGKKIRYYDPELGESYVPFVVETSIGVDRMFLQVISASYCEEQLEKDTRTVLKLPPVLAPIKLAVMPLVKKDGLPEKAREIIDELKFDFNCQYDEKDSIGRRYRRQDAIGTPFCITIDHQTKEDNTVTIRERDSMKQDRIAIDEIASIIRNRIKG